MWMMWPMESSELNSNSSRTAEHTPATTPSSVSSATQRVPGSRRSDEMTICFHKKGHFNAGLYAFCAYVSYTCVTAFELWQFEGAIMKLSGDASSFTIADHYKPPFTLLCTRVPLTTCTALTTIPLLVGIARARRHLLMPWLLLASMHTLFDPVAMIYCWSRYWDIMTQMHKFDGDKRESRMQFLMSLYAIFITLNLIAIGAISRYYWKILKRYRCSNCGSAMEASRRSICHRCEHLKPPSYHDYLTCSRELCTLSTESGGLSPPPYNYAHRIINADNQKLPESTV